jgi:hypothetical protein
VRTLASLLTALMVTGVVGGSGYALTGVGRDDAVAPVDDPIIIYELPWWAQRPCLLTSAMQPIYLTCDTRATPVSDSRTGASYTTTVVMEVCRREASGDECVGTTQSVGRTGAETGPSVQQTSGPMALPQACVGSTCTPPGALSNAPKKVTVFDAGTAPEASVYTGTGAVNANAPQACVSVDNSCTGSTSGTTKSAGLENVNATQLVTTQ